MRSSGVNYAEKLFELLDHDGSGRLNAMEMLMAEELLVMRTVTEDSVWERDDDDVLEQEKVCV